MFKKVVLYLTASGGTIGGLAYAVNQNISVFTPTVHTYHAKVPVKGTESEVKKAVQYLNSHTGSRTYYDLRFSHSMNHEYIHLDIQSYEKITDLNSLWFNLFSFNHLSMDRYGFTNAGGMESTDPHYREIFNWRNFDLTNFRSQRKIEGRVLPEMMKMSLTGDMSELQEKEFEKLVEIELGKPDLPEKHRGRANNYFFFWLNKEMLRVKLNYLLQTWVFNQPSAQEKDDIKSRLGDKKEGGSLINETSGVTKDVTKWATVKENWKRMSPVEKEFIENYVALFVRGEGVSETDWDDAVVRVTKKEDFITSQKVNEIYNYFIAKEKKVDIFEKHLLGRITGLSAVDVFSSSYDMDKFKRLPRAGDVLDVNKFNLVRGTMTMRDIFETLMVVVPIDVDYLDKDISDTYSEDKDKHQWLMYMEPVSELPEVFYVTVAGIVLSSIFIAIFFVFLLSYGWPAMVYITGLVVSCLVSLNLFFTLGRGFNFDLLTSLGLLVVFGMFFVVTLLERLKRLFKKSGLFRESLVATLVKGGKEISSFCLPLFIAGVVFASLSSGTMSGFGISFALGCLSLFLFVYLLPSLFLLLAPMALYDGWFCAVFGKFRGVKIDILGKMNRIGKDIGLLSGISLFSLLGIGLWFWKGFNSDVIVDGGYLLRFLGDEWSLVEGKSVTSLPSRITSGGFQNTILISENEIDGFRNDFKDILKPESYTFLRSSYIESSPDFYELFPQMSLVLLSVSFVYSLFNGLLGGLRVFLNSCFTGILFFSIVTIFRIPVFSSIVFTFLFSIFLFLFLEMSGGSRYSWEVKGYRLLLILALLVVSFTNKHLALIGVACLVSLLIPLLSSVFERVVSYFYEMAKRLVSKIDNPAFRQFGGIEEVLLD